MAKTKNYNALIEKVREQITKTEEKLATLKEEEQKLIDEKSKYEMSCICDMMHEYNVSIEELEELLKNKLSSDNNKNEQNSEDLIDTVA